MIDTSTNLPYYRCHKKVQAAKIKSIYPGRLDEKGPGQTLEFKDSYIPPVSVGEDYVAKHHPEEGGYYVLYEDGYESFSPAKAFEDGYTRI